MYVCKRPVIYVTAIRSLSSFKHSIIGFFLLFFVHYAINAQNLIVNGDFEEFYSCPVQHTDRPYVPLVPGWESADEGTPDYFNRCSNTNSGVPYNWAGVSEAHSGDGYTGIYVYHNTGGYKEYLKTTFLRPLEKGKEYILTFYYKLAGYATYSIDRMGVKILVDEGAPYILEFIKGASLDEKTGSWEQVYDTIVAKGGETGLVIGNFAIRDDTHSTELKYRSGTEPMMNGRSYYLVDNVSLMSLDYLPKQIPVDSLAIETVYTFNNVQFEFDKDALVDSTRLEIEELARYMLEREGLYVELLGHTDEMGTEEYNQDLSERRARSVAKYLITLGVEKRRISYRGLGETMLLVQGEDNGSGQKNRRVEFVLYTEERFIKSR